MKTQAIYLFLCLWVSCLVSNAQLRFTKEIANIATLKTLNVNDVNKTAQVRGYVTNGDGGGGLFEYDATASGTPDSGIRIAPNTGSGMWIRKVAGREYMARWWGPNKTNSTLQAAIDWVSANGYGGVTADGGTWYVKTDDSTRILMKSGVTLKTAEDSMIVALPNPTNNWILIDFPIGASDCGVGPARLIGWNILPPGGDTNKSGLIFSLQDTTNVVIGGVRADNWYTKYADVGSGNVNLKMLDEEWRPTMRGLGAKGDGRDDTKNLQSAIHYNERYNQKAVLPWTTNGYLTTTLYITNGVGLVLEGEGKPTLKFYYSNPTEGVLPHFSGLMFSADNCVFRGLKFQTVGAYPVTETNSNSGGFFVPLVGHVIGTNTLIEDCEFDVESGKGFTGSGNYTKLKDCFFNRCGLSFGLGNATNWLWYEAASPFKGQKYSPLSVSIINCTFSKGSPFKHTVLLSSSDDFLFEGNRLLDMNTICPLQIYSGDEGVTDILGTNLYKYSGRILNNTITGTNFGPNAAIFVSVSTPTNYVAPTFDPYAMYSAITVKGNDIFGTGVSSNSIGIELLSARDTRITENYVQTTGRPLTLVGNNSRIIVDRNHLEGTAISVITSADGFLQPALNENIAFRHNNIVTPEGEECAFRNIEPIKFKNLRIFDNDFRFRGTNGSGDFPKVIQLSGNEGYVNVAWNRFHLTNSMSNRRIVTLAGTNTSTTFSFNCSIIQSNAVVILRGLGANGPGIVHVEGNQVGSMDFDSVRELKLLGNDLTSSNSAIIPLEITLTDKAIVAHNSLSNYWTGSALVASIGATNSVFEHNIVSGNSSSDIVRSSLGEMLVGNNVFRNTGGGFTYPNTNGTGTISHYIYKHGVPINIGSLSDWLLTLQRAGSTNVMALHTDGNNAGYYSWPFVTNLVSGHTFWVHEANTPTNTFAEAFSVIAPPGTNVILRLDANRDLSAVVIGSGLTYDGTTLTSVGGLSGSLTSPRIPVASGATTLVDSSLSMSDTNLVLFRNNTSGVYLIPSNTLGAVRFGISGVTAIIEAETAGSSIQMNIAGVPLWEFGPSSFGPFTDNNLNLGTGPKRIMSAHIGTSIKLGTSTHPAVIQAGGGNPETVITGNPGDIFVRTNGSAGNIVYVKETGVATTSGWNPMSRGYPMDLLVDDGGNPADSTTYFVGQDANTIPSIFSIVQSRVPRTGTVKGVSLKVHSVAGSSETVNFYIRINDTTDFANVTGDMSVNTLDLLVSGLSQAVVEGDYLALKIVTPAWVTNPTAWSLWAKLWIE